MKDEYKNVDIVYGKLMQYNIKRDYR